jgi:hypothetical protein
MDCPGSVDDLVRAIQKEMDKTARQDQGQVTGILWGLHL